MIGGESTQNLPAAEVTECSFSDESNDVEDTKRMQITIQYGASSSTG